MIARGVVLLVIAILELLLGLYIYNRDKKNAVNITFLFTTIGVVIWVTVNSYLALGSDINSALWYKLAYFSGVIIASSFLYFARVFPYRIFHTGRIMKTIALVPIAVFAGLTFFTDTIIINVINIGQIPEVHFGDWFVIYVILFISFFCWALTTLIRKYRRSNGMHYWQLKYVIISVLIPIIANLISDILFYRGLVMSVSRG